MQRRSSNRKDICEEGSMISLNGTPVFPTVFPDKTSQVWKIDDIGCNVNEIFWEFSSESELIQLAQLKDLLDACEGEHCTLKIKYLPYGRQDKPVTNSTTFGLHTFAQILNGMLFDKVIIVDPHSLVALDLIHNSSATYPIYALHKSLQTTASDMICYPDKGALTKYTKVYDDFLQPYIYGEKVRDQLTGNITSYQVIGDPKGKKVMIIDDICDGGATFKLLAKDLLAAGATEVNLFVTHGIFSRGLATLFETGIKRIFTQDGEASEDDNKINYRRL